MIGKLSSTLDRGFVYDLVPTPPNDAGEPACSLIDATTIANTTFKDEKRKGSKPVSQAADSSTLAIDKDWVAEHARQVYSSIPTYLLITLFLLILSVN